MIILNIRGAKASLIPIQDQAKNTRRITRGMANVMNVDMNGMSAYVLHIDAQKARMTNHKKHRSNCILSHLLALYTPQASAANDSHIISHIFNKKEAKI